MIRRLNKWLFLLLPSDLQLCCFFCEMRRKPLQKGPSKRSKCRYRVPKKIVPSSFSGDSRTVRSSLSIPPKYINQHPFERKRAAATAKRNGRRPVYCAKSRLNPILQTPNADIVPRKGAIGGIWTTANLLGH